RRRFCIRDLLLPHHLAILEKVARANLAAKVLILELFNPLVILEFYPNINSPIVISIRLLSYDLALFVKQSQIKKAIPVGISFLPNQLIVFEVLDSIPFSSALGIAPASVEPSLGECLNHVDSPATGCVLFSTDYLFSLEVNDSGELSIAPK